jgi:dihydrofolate synthase/folylpolyglutamate synthase
MDYPDSVQFLYALGNEIKTAKFGLERIRTVLKALRCPHLGLKAVHVAGTNGKGSACAMIESGLRAAGVRTGLFTSPHLVEPTERIRLDGRPIAAEEFAAAFERVHAAVEDLLREGRVDSHTTYFETVTAMAFLTFAEAGVQTAVLEVGLGGRLDATNVVTPKLAVITPVDFDHEAWLGKSLESIAFEKAGILKPGVPAVIAEQRAEAAVVLEARAAELGVTVEHTSQWEVHDLNLHARGSRFRLIGPQTVAVDCPLAGEHQVENARTAVAALAGLGVPGEAIETGIARAEWPGRLECVSEHPEIILDGAHNPAGARALAAFLERFYAGRPVWMIYGAMRDKSVAEITGTLFSRAARVIVTAPDQARAVRPETIRELSDHPDIRVAASLADALAQSESAPRDAVVIVTGSLFLVGEAKQHFPRR